MQSIPRPIGKHYARQKKFRIRLRAAKKQPDQAGCKRNYGFDIHVMQGSEIACRHRTAVELGVLSRFIKWAT